MNAPEQIETARLLLRRPMSADADAIFERYARDPEVTRYLGWPRHESVEQTRAFLANSDAQWAAWPGGPYLMAARESGRILGSTGITFETAYRAVTGYVLARDAWGQGYATEALQAMVSVAPQLGLFRLYALCHAEHERSARVLDKCGFTREGILRRHTAFPNLAVEEPCDVLCYAIVFGHTIGQPSIAPQN